MVCFVPSYFGFKIVEQKYTGSNDSEIYFQRVANGFGKTMYFKIYFVSLATFEGFLIVSMTVMNLMSLFKFRKLVNEKKRLTIRPEQNRLMTERRHIDQANIRFTRLIIILTFIQIFSQIFERASGILIRIVINNDAIHNLRQFDSLLATLRRLNYFLQISIHSLDGIFYFFCDFQLRRAFRGLFRRQYI